MSATPESPTLAASPPQEHERESQIKGAGSVTKKSMVLIAIDASPQAEHAFDWYLENIHTDDKDLLLVHIADPPFVSTQQVVYMSGELWSQMLAQEKERINELENKFAAKMRTNGASGRIRALFDARPGEVLVDIAKKEKVNMVVMGTRGLGTIRRTILGSVSDHVLHHVHCPVCIVRPEDVTHHS